MQWGTVEVPPPGSYSHAPSSSQSSDHAASESTMPNPQDESDFMIDPIFLSDGEFSAPVTSESSPAVTKEDIWSLLSGTLFSETYHQSFELLQVSYSDHNILHTVTLLTVITMANHARLECGAMQKETLMETMTV